MGKRLLLLVSAGAGAASGGGHDLCWHEPNWQGLELSYDRCCQEGDELELKDDCFRTLGGWYSHEFCCYPPVQDGCDWPGVLQRMELKASGSSQAELLQMFRTFPVVLREFCCLFPGSGEQGQFYCWDGETPDHGHEGVEVLPEAFVQCCFPVLRRRLHSPDDDPAWLAEELDRELAPLAGRRWSPAELDAFEAGTVAERGNQPCRLRVRGGHEVVLCDLADSCPAETDPNNDCSYILAFSLALQIVGRIRPLPDMDLFVSPINQDVKETAVPVFTRHRPFEPRGLYALLPMEWQLHPRQIRKHLTPAERVGARIPWEHRTPEVLWRGTNSNCFPSCSIAKAARGDVPLAACLERLDCGPWTWENWLNTPRGRLVFLTQFVEGINARWTGTSQEIEPSLWRYFEEHNLTAPRMSLDDQTHWRYALNIDGTGNGDRVYWQMHAGLLVLVQESPFVSWLVGPVGGQAPAALRPFRHYVPVRYDLSDLPARLSWLLSHDVEAQRIAEAGRRFAVRHLSYDGVLVYVERLVRRYATEHLRSAE